MYKTLILAVNVIAMCFSSTVSVASAEEHLRALQYNPSGDSQMQKEMLKVVNAKRAENGLEPYCLNKKLVQAAQVHSEDMARSGQMSHTGSDGSSMSDRMKRAGFMGNGAAENVAAGQQSVQSVVDSWMKSPGHRRNILGKYKYFGVGYSTGSSQYKHYWTQTFGNANGESCMGNCKPKY